MTILIDHDCLGVTHSSNQFSFVPPLPISVMCHRIKCQIIVVSEAPKRLRYRPIFASTNHRPSRHSWLFAETPKWGLINWNRLLKLMLMFITPSTSMPSLRCDLDRWADGKKAFHFRFSFQIEQIIRFWFQFGHRPHSTERFQHNWSFPAAVFSIGDAGPLANRLR